MTALSMRVRLLLSLVSAGVATGCASPPAPVPAPAHRPDVVLVTIDTMRADRVGPALTPATMSLIARGTAFTSARTVAPLTLPAHASLMTGLYPPRHGVRLNGVHTLGSGVPRVARWLQEAGYDTAAFVGAYVLDRRFGLAEGFATYDDRIPRAPRAMDRLEAERPGDVVTARALEWLARQDRPIQRPVFLWVHLYDPHAPYAPAAEYLARAGGDAYDGEVAFADAQVGRLTGWFASAGRGAPLVVVASDHGESLGDHGEPTHGMLLYESAVRVALVIAGPGVPQGRRADPVSLVDVAPTILAQVGVPAPAGLDGRDLFAAGSPGAERAVFAETEYPRLAGWMPLAMLADARWKAIVASAPELYDIDRDPGEHTNLADSRADTAAAMARQVMAWKAASKADVEDRPVAADVAERLRALGYVAAAASPSVLDADAKHPAAMMPAWREFEAATVSLGAGDRGDAIRRLAALARAHPESALFSTTCARALADAGRHGEALAIYRRAVERWPGDAAMLHDLAVSARAAGRLEEARRAEEAALVIDPSNALAHNGLGLLLADAGRAAEALRSFARAARLDPTNPRYHVHVGNAARDTGDLAAAEAAYRKSLDLDAAMTDALNGLGVVLVQTGRPRDALGPLERALAVDPAFVEARLNLGIARQESGDVAGARAAYREVARAASGFARERAAAAALLSALDRSASSAPR